MLTMQRTQRQTANNITILSHRHLPVVRRLRDLLQALSLIFQDKQNGLHLLRRQCHLHGLGQYHLYIDVRRERSGEYIF